MIEDELVEVTQADREAAWPIWKWLYVDSPGAEQLTRKHFMEGDSDDHFIVQAFARHRFSAINPVRVREEERERIVAWLRREHVEIRAMRAGIRNLDECADAIMAGEHHKTNANP